MIPGIVIACITAGPAFLTAALVATVSRPDVSLGASGLTIFLLMLVFSVMYGTFLAIIPTIVGALAMAKVADQFEEARLPAVWVFVGAIMGMLLGLVFGAEAESCWGTAGAGAWCAGMCRLCISWVEPADMDA